MPDLFADPSGAGDNGLTYRYRNFRGLPFRGDPGYMKPQEYLNLTVTTAAVGYGNFDTAIPDQRFFGRTLHEVLSRTVAGEYKVLRHLEQWVRCQKFGVRIMYFVQWVEYVDRFKQDAVAASSPTLNSIPNSR